MNKKIVGGVIAGVVGVVGGIAVFFNKKRHADEFDEADIARDEYSEIEDSEEETEK